MTIAKDAGDLALGNERVGEGRGKARRSGREIGPIEFDGKPSHLPVAAWRILAAAPLDRIAPGAGKRRARREPGGKMSGTGRRGGAKAQGFELRQAKRLRRGDMAERIGAAIAER